MEINCPNCNSTDVIRKGFDRTSKEMRQRYKCKNCRRKFVAKDEDTTERNYQQNWPAYNAAQVEEKIQFLDILGDLCSYIPDYPDGKVGRPRMSLQQMTFCVVSKVYERLSTRRVSSDLEIAKDNGYVEKVPHFNTLIKYFNDPALTPILTQLVQLSATPLKDLETTFAVDATGLSSAFYSRWLDYRFNGDKRVKDWLKVNLICGVKSHIVTHIIVTDGHSHESPYFSELVAETAKNFKIDAVCADKGYSSKENLQTVWDLGGAPLIPFKSNTKGKKKGGYAWRKMFMWFQFNKEEFYHRYHERSNVESTFSMLKRKFSTRLMMRHGIGQTNEALAMVLCHNILCLIHEMHENGLDIEVQELAHKMGLLHINSGLEGQKS